MTDRDDPLYRLAMTRELRLPSRAAVAAAVIAGALLIGAFVALGSGGPTSVAGAADVAPAPGTSASPTPLVADGPSSVTFLGDSWTEGVGATAARGYAVLAGEQLGWEYDLLGVSGSGYSLRGKDGVRGSFGERVDETVATGADVIVVQGSLNEHRSTLEALAPAARETLGRLRAATDPAVRIVVLGAAYNPGVPAGTIDAINAVIRVAAAQAGVEFVDVAAENWSDPADPGIWFDPIHPNDAGHQRIADRLVPLLLDAPGR